MAANPSRYERTRCYRRGWVFERTGWAVMTATLLGAGFGVFGDGWLSAARTAAGESLAAGYPRFCRAHAPLDLTVE